MHVLGRAWLRGWEGVKPFSSARRGGTWLVYYKVYFLAYYICSLVNYKILKCAFQILRKRFENLLLAQNEHRAEAQLILTK